MTSKTKTLLNQSFKIGMIALFISFLFVYVWVSLPIIHENFILYSDYRLLEIITNFMVIFSVIVSPLAFFIKRWHDKRSNRKNTGCSILQEIEKIKQDLKCNGENNIIKHTYDKNKEIKFCYIYFEDASFQSAINSGHYTLFSLKLQRSLNQIYLRIKLNNRTIDRNQELNLFCIQHEIKKGTEKYYEIMGEVWIQATKIQKELSEHIEITTNELKKIIS